VHKNDFFDKLYTDWYERLLKYVYRLTLEKNSAEDIVQDTFIEAYKKSDLLQHHESPEGWLYVTARNKARNYLRKERKSNTAVYQDNNCSYQGANEDDFEILVADKLSKEDTDIVKRFYKYRQTITEIARAYNISASACKMRLKRARDKLKAFYKENYYGM